MLNHNPQPAFPPKTARSSRRFLTAVYSIAHAAPKHRHDPQPTVTRQRPHTSERDQREDDQAASRHVDPEHRRATRVQRSATFQTPRQRPRGRRSGKPEQAADRASEPETRVARQHLATREDANATASVRSKRRPKTERIDPTPCRRCARRKGQQHRQAVKVHPEGNLPLGSHHTAALRQCERSASRTQPIHRGAGTAHPSLMG